MDVLHLLPSLVKGVVPMVTYTELFQFVTMICAVITLVLYANKK